MTPLKAITTSAVVIAIAVAVISGSIVYVTFNSTTSSPTTLVTCSQARSPAGFLEVNASMNPTGLICLQIYYYNSTTSMILNTSQALSIWASKPVGNGSDISQRPLSGASNFTVTASPSRLTVGGPDNENEGAVIAYAITAKPGASGTYWLGVLKSNSQSSYMINSGFPLSCGYDGELVAGNGQPDYAQFRGGCITFITYQ